jgi:polysaccharide pyruvyl transferase WcaK-like protein
MTPSVLLLTSYDHDDVGGQAVLAGLCESLHCAEPGVRITVVSSSAQAADLPGVVRVIPRGVRGLAQLLHAARRQDAVVVDDGGCRHDDGSSITAWLHHARLKLLRLVNNNVRVQALGTGPAPDPAFALSPAAPADADRMLRALGIDPHRPLIGVVMRGLDERHAGSPWEWLQRPVLQADAARDIELARVLDQVALAVETLARQTDAAVLLLPTSNSGPESDSGYCYQLAAMLQLDCVRVAQLHDPRLYKAVCGQLELMISARVHPVLLAAGMGVPGVALATGREFDRHFDTLEIPRRVVPLDDFRDGTQAELLVALGEEAMNARVDLREHCERLRARLVRNAAAWLQPSAAGEARRPVPGRPASGRPLSTRALSGRPASSRPS